MNNFSQFVDFFWSSVQDPERIIQRAKSQFDQIFLELNHTPGEVLILGYKNALSLSFENHNTAVDFIQQPRKRYDTVIALDEYFTYTADEDTQRQMITDCLSVLNPGGIMFTSVRDYRNNPVHKKSLGDTSCVNINGNTHIIVEVNESGVRDRQSWTQKNYTINTNNNDTQCYNIGHRRTLYFKQLAKYCNDAGCTQFGILRENFWKNPLRKNTEHIAWTRYNK